MKKETYREKMDGELVAAVRDGDSLAFDALFIRWYPQVRKFLLTLVKVEALAEDLAQMVFMKVWLYRARLDPAKSLKNYLLVLSRNAALDVFRSKKNLMMIDLPAPPEKTAPDQTEYKAEYTEAHSRILNAVAQMPAQRREVFRMSRFQHLSSEEIATELGLSVRTVEKHLQLALKDLRKYLS